VSKKSSRQKIWSSQSIRELARKRLSEDSVASDLSHEKPLESPLSPKAVTETSFEFEFGRFEKAKGERVIVVEPYVFQKEKIAQGFDFKQQASQDLEEMVSLCRTLGLQVVIEKTLHLKKGPVARTYIGRGVLDSLALDLKNTGSVALVIDAPLSPGQVKNIEKQIGAPVLDRESVILSIFERHAKTSLSKMQVELARLKYLQPRLAGIWSGLSRQSGGGGQVGRGQGETRLELDRRNVKERISVLTQKLKEAEKQMQVQSQSRSSLPRVALVGYTNAGKSSLMNKLTSADVLQSSKLFATLDTTVRTLEPPTVPRILVSDTVGFVKNLPPNVVASFKSTLREAMNSPLLLNVVDVSGDQVLSDFQVTQTILKQMGLKTQSQILVLNKIDLLNPKTRKLKIFELRKHFELELPDLKMHVISCVGTGEGLLELKKTIMNFFGADYPEWVKKKESEIQIPL
jgi:GTP-binding protein HflX